MSDVDRAAGALAALREFKDEVGRSWVAGVRSRPGKDFKGRYFFVARPKGAEIEEEVRLEDVRWNSEETARRTIETMSGVELRRRLRAATGRGPQPARRTG